MRELHTTRNELQAARNHIKHVEIENAKLTTERDTLRDILNKGNPVIDPVLSNPSWATHNGIRFWTIDNFEKWLSTPEAQVANCGKEPYLEEENRDPVSVRRVRDIKACMRSVFCELVSKKQAPQVWGSLDTSARELFHSHVEKSYLLFKCAENGWKLDRLAWATYPAWRAFHLDENMNWRMKEGKKEHQLKRKNTGEESPHPHKLKRVNSEAVETSAFGGNALRNGSDGSSSTASARSPVDLNSSFMSGESEPRTSVVQDEDAMMVINTFASPAVKDNSTVEENTSFTVEEGPFPGIEENAFPGIKNTPPATKKAPAEVPDINNSPPATEKAPAEENASPAMHHTNPLDCLVQVAAKLNIAIPPITPSGTATPSAASSSSSLATSSSALKKISKMCPGPVRNGRNLCAHRWLKHFKDSTNGTMAEFKDYYESLSKQQQESYDKEAQDLVSRKAWNKDAYNGAMF